MKKLESQLQNRMAKTGKKSEATDPSIDDLGRKLDMMKENLLPVQNGILGSCYCPLQGPT